MLESVVQPTIDNGEDHNDTIELLIKSTVFRRMGILAHQVNDFHFQISWSTITDRY